MRTLVNTTLAFALLVLLPGCDTIFDSIERTEPSTSVSQGTAISTEDGALAVRSSMYDRFHAEDLSTDWFAGPSSLADNNFFTSSSARHSGLNLNVLRAGIGTGSRDNIYDGVNDANLLVNGIREGTLDEATGNKLEAEGRFVRALLYHHAVRIFGYDPMSPDGPLVTPASGPGSGFELGVVLRTEPTLGRDQAEPLPRSTVLDVYDQIETDLNTAIDLFSGLPGGEKSGNDAFATEPAAHALLARVHLYQRNYSGAEQQAQTALDQANARFGAQLAEPTPEAVYNIFDETNNMVESIFRIDTNPVTESAGVNNAISTWYATQWLAQAPTQDLISLYSADDVRLVDQAIQESGAGWYSPCFNEEESSDLTGTCEAVNDQALELQKWNQEQGSFADDYQHLRVAEMKLIQAEARLQGSGLGDPAVPLNDLRNARGLDDLSTSEIDMQEILDERRRELVAEGHRFFDLKRLGRDISKAAGRDDLQFSNFRILDDISPAQLDANQELQQNPGYQ